uniref:Uncharacterized protein n=1 Tax=Micrurus spixii TaxID=129469 RepID=A0A2D4N5E1_9SAUR
MLALGGGAEELTILGDRASWVTWATALTWEQICIKHVILFFFVGSRSAILGQTKDPHHLCNEPEFDLWKSFNSIVALNIALNNPPPNLSSSPKPYYSYITLYNF